MTADKPELSILRLRTNDLTWREIDGQVIVLDLIANRYVSINGTGVLLWSFIVEGTTSPALVEAILECYELDHGTAEADVEAFVGSLRATGLIA